MLPSLLLSFASHPVGEVTSKRSVLKAIYVAASNNTFQHCLSNIDNDALIVMEYFLKNADDSSVH